MTHLQKEASFIRKVALTAGISLIIMALAAFFSYGLVYGKLVVPGKANVTLNHILSSSQLFNAGIFGWLIILICDIIVSWCFYIILKPISKNLSLLGAWLRLTYVGILGIAILNLIFVSILTRKADYLSTFTTDQLQTYVMLFLEAFDFSWSIGLIIFGGHLLIVDYLAYRSDFIPKIISILLLIGAISYMLIHLCYSFLPQLDSITGILESILSVPMALGELGFGIWLLVKGGKAPKSA